MAGKESTLDVRREKEISSTFQAIPFLSCLSDEERVEIRKHLIIRDHRRHDIILYAEDSSTYLYIILSGRVKVIQTSNDGKEHILAIRKKGDFFGEMGLLDGKTSPATVLALEDSRVCLISREVFSTRLLTNPKVIDIIISLLCSRLRDAWLKIQVLSFADAEQRLRAVLRDLSHQFGIPDSRGVMISLHITHQDMAYLSSTSRETVTRFLNKAASSGEIEILADKNILLKNTFLKEIDAL